PRGQYHDALATTDASLHVTFSVQPMNGLAVIDLLRKEAARESIFRDDLPGADGDNAALQARLAALGQRLSDLARIDQFERVIRQEQRTRSRPRGTFSLPQRPTDAHYVVANRNLRMTPRGDGQVLSDGHQEISVGAHIMPLVQWIFAASDFTFGEAVAEFPALARDEVNDLVSAMAAMGVLRKL
ncbi:MAG TPA: hypothetical protein PLS69_13675, partial [Terricaulis sp.]|nr:hypothetical protein [Terricaulis sp.]